MKSSIELDHVQGGGTESSRRCRSDTTSSSRSRWARMAAARGRRRSFAWEDLILAARQVDLDGAARLTGARLSKALIVDPAMRLVVKAQELAPPSEGATPLALISTFITVEAAPPLPSRRRSARTSPPRHSVLIPTLNGRETLEVVLTPTSCPGSRTASRSWSATTTPRGRHLGVPERPARRTAHRPATSGAGGLRSNADWRIAMPGANGWGISATTIKSSVRASRDRPRRIAFRRRNDLRESDPVLLAELLAPELANTLDGATFTATRSS